MADSKLANLLRNDNAWKGDADLAAFNQFEAQAEPWYNKALPMEGRAILAPIRNTMEGSVFNQKEWALPAPVAWAVNALTAGNRAYTGADPTFNPQEEAASFANGIMGGGVGASRAMTAPMGVGGKDLALNAWHGTPHEVKGQFDLAKVGTGEGAQAYGYGTYFGEARGTGEMYRDTLGFVGAKDKTGEIYGKDGISFFFENALEKNGVSSGAAKSQAQLWADKFVKGETINNPIAMQVIEAKGLQPNNIGNLYKVDIPDSAIPQMLDWDKPLSQQQHIWDKLPQDVRNSIDDALENSGRTSMSDALGEYKGRHLYKALEHHEVHESLPPQIGNSDWFKGDTSPAQHTSAFLNSIGVTGVKYLDQASRKDGKGTSNFVVFDPATVKILEKNDKPVDRKELIKEQIDKLTE